VLTAYSCSLQKKATQKIITPVISDIQINNTINQSVEELLQGQWLSTFLLENDSRPTITTTTIKNNTQAQINTENIYTQIDNLLTQSGQVRVIKSDSVQRQLTPQQISRGKSIDYGISVNIEKNPIQNTTKYTFILSLWNDISDTAIQQIEKSIE
jgi:hypothetical protein